MGSQETGKNAPTSTGWLYVGSVGTNTCGPVNMLGAGYVVGCRLLSACRAFNADNGSASLGFGGNAFRSRSVFSAKFMGISSQIGGFIANQGKSSSHTGSCVGPWM